MCASSAGPGHLHLLNGLYDANLSTRDIVQLPGAPALKGS
jgi:thiamine pyrophosphate-dependent acetolactate synthase large subunit-like protein